MSTKQYICIKGLGSISPLGSTPEEVTNNYNLANSLISPRTFNENQVPVASLSLSDEEKIIKLKQENRYYKTVDRTVLLSLVAARQAVEQAGWQQEKEMAINMGSSRGATGLFEHFHDEFRSNPKHLSSQASPSTTLGNISSWVANDLETNGPVISHSITCSTAVQAMANGFAWLKSGMAKRFLAGGSEAPLTPFTLAQMQAIGIYSTNQVNNYWCRPVNAEKQNTFVLGEGAAVFALELVSEQNLSQDSVILESIEFGFEKIVSRTGISPEGLNFQKAIREALNNLPAADRAIDIIVLHAPGTVAGDHAELNAVKAVFGSQVPVVTSNKMLIGHTLGASAALSLEYAIWILNHQSLLPFNYPVFIKPPDKPKKIRRLLLLSAGFGGNASALVVRKG